MPLNTNKLVNSPGNPDCLMTLRRNLDKDYQESLDSYSHHDILIDPHSSLDWEPELISSRVSELKTLIEKYKDVFQGTIGEVRHPEFIVHAKIDDEASTLSGSLYYKQAPTSNRHTHDTHVIKVLVMK